MVRRSSLQILQENYFCLYTAVSAGKCFIKVKPPKALTETLIALIVNKGVVTDDGVNTFVANFVAALQGAGLSFDVGKFSE